MSGARGEESGAGYREHILSTENTFYHAHLGELAVMALDLLARFGVYQFERLV